MDLSIISWKVRFELSRLWMPIEPIVYDSKFNPGDVTDYYERYIVTHEIGGYRLWHISFFVSNSLNIRKLDLFSDKLFAVEVVKAVADDKYFIGNQVKNSFNHKIGSILIEISLSSVLGFSLGVAANNLFEHYYNLVLSTKPIQWSQIMLNLMEDCTTEKPKYKWEPPLLLRGSDTLKKSCDRTLE